MDEYLMVGGIIWQWKWKRKELGFRLWLGGDRRRGPYGRGLG